MHAKTLFFGVWKTQYDCLALRHLAVCTKIFFFFFQFFLSWRKLSVLIPDFVFLRHKIQTDIIQNSVK
jgi:hypothetical protein